MPDEPLDELEIVERTQEFTLEKAAPVLLYKIGDKVIHSSYYIRNFLRGNAKLKAQDAVYEVIGCTSRSVTVKPWGSAHKYGSQFPIKYIEKVHNPPPV